MNDPTASSPGTRSAVPWSFAMSIGQVLFSSIIMFVLASMVGPDNFGLMTLGLLLILFLQMILQQGLGAAVIQREDLRNEHLDAAFWMVMGSTAVLTVVGAAIAPWWATINDEPDLTSVVWVLLALLPIRGLIVVQDALLRREMRFKALAARTNLGVVVGGLAGVAAALAGAGVWALVTQQLAQAATELAVLWRASHFRPGLHFSRPHARDLMGFSAGSFATSIGLYVGGRSDELSMGLFFETRALGLYRLAYRIMSMVADVITRALQPVSLSELARLQNDPRRFAQRVIATVSLSAIFIFPAMAILASSAPPLVELLGPEWEGTTVPLQLLCIEGVAIGVTFLVGPVLQALGRPHHQAVLVWVTAIVSGIAFFAAGYLLQDDAIDRQVVGLTLVNIVLYAMLAATINLVIVARVTRTPVLRFLGVMAGPAVAGLGAVVVGTLTLQWLESSTGPLFRLIVTATVASVTALVLLLATTPKVRGALSSGLDGRYHDALDELLDLKEEPVTT